MNPMTEREIDLTDAALHERTIQVFFAAFQSEAVALVHQKVLPRAECSSLVSAFARIAADTSIALRDAARVEADREATKRMQVGSDMVLDAYKAHHATFHSECNIEGPARLPSAQEASRDS